MALVTPATADNVEQVVALQRRLFEEDAAVHDTHVDLTWNDREGRADILGLIDDPASVVLIAIDEAGGQADIVGFVAGYSHRASPTRHPVIFAELRSMFVAPGHRSGGVGKALAEHFIAWARTMQCAEVHVSAYVANERAQAFYNQLGFVPRSLSRSLTL